MAAETTSAASNRVLLREVSVPLCGAWLSVPEQCLDHVERYALVDQEARKRVSQIVQPNVEETCAPPDAIPRIEYRCETTPSGRGRKDVAGVSRWQQRPQQCDRLGTEGNPPWPAGLGHRHEQGAFLPVDVLPTWPA